MNLATVERVFLPGERLAATEPTLVGKPYQDADSTGYLPMPGHPVLVFEAEKEVLTSAHTRALERGLRPAVFTAELFATGNDEANRAVVKAVRGNDLDPVGPLVFGPRNSEDKVVRGSAVASLTRLHRDATQLRRPRCFHRVPPARFTRLILCAVVGNLRSRLVSWFTRRYFARVQKKGLDLSKMALLPDGVLMPLRRNGLDPVAELGRKRAEEPVSRLPVPFGLNLWLVSGYDEAKAVLGDAKTFSNDFTNLVGKTSVQADDNPGGLGFADPPVHTRLRRLLTPEFTMRRLSRLKPGIERIVNERLDAMARADGPVDLVEEFALPIPSLVICELLGVPYEDRDEFQHLAVQRFDLFGGAGASLGAISESLEYLLRVVRKERENPGDGLLGMIIKEHGDEVEDRELAGLADGVLTGGFETTASMLSLGALVLLRDQESFKRVHDDDEVVHGFVEELLRYLTVVQVAFPRFAREDIEVGGKTIAKGDMVVVSLSGANRDEKLGDSLEIFDGTRPASSHLAFGYGVHRCVGAELARMELRAAYPALVRRFPKMRLAVPAEELEFRKTSIVYGVEKLPVHVD